MSGLIAARAQFGISLGFHIIFASLGVGLPLFLFITEGLGLRKRDKVWYTLARRWSRAFGVLFAVGAVSGTIISFELGLLWPRFMHFAGGIIGLPFAVESFAFFTEGIFLGLYLYGWNRLSPVTHWLCTIPLMLAGLASSLVVVMANAWMNTPAGFRLVNGQLAYVDPLAATFNPSAFSETTHMALAAYEATGATIAAVFAWGLLRGRRDLYLKRGVTLGMLIAGIVAPLQILAGDWNARVVAQTQPAKLAAMEALFKTTKGAPETIFGWPDVQTGQTYYAIRVPHLLSFLVSGDPNSTVPGLEATPKGLQPDPRIIHYTFDTMVSIGFFVLALAVWFWFFYFKNGRKVFLHGLIGKLTLIGLVAAGPLTFLAIEAGWVTTCIGRQPWIVQGYMFTRDAVTPAPGLGLTFAIFMLTYLVLSGTTIRLVRRLAGERGEEGTDIDEPVPLPPPGRSEQDEQEASRQTRGASRAGDPIGTA